MTRSGVCDTCQDWMQKGIVCISVLGNPGELYREWSCSCGHTFAALVKRANVGQMESLSGEDSVFCPKCGFSPRTAMPAKELDEKNPYRTGKLAVITEDALRRILVEPLLSRVLHSRVMFLPDEVWHRLGFPEQDLEPSSATAENPDESLDTQDKGDDNDQTE